MMDEGRLRFVEAVRELNGPVMFELLPELGAADLTWFREHWFSGQSAPLDPTNVLCAGDYADQFLNLPGHAIALYDAALEYMDKHTDSIAEDTNCAAASLNLIDSLLKAGQREAAATAARRAARMPVKRGDQNCQLAAWLFQFGDPKAADALFQRAKAAGLASVAAAMGVTLEDLNQMDRLLCAAVPRPQGGGFCTSCGVPTSPQDRFCTKCGAPISWGGGIRA
jgi:tetratricopeptide (TPR) repeat protein